jgi:hypothetical protein
MTDSWSTSGPQTRALVVKHRTRQTIRAGRLWHGHYPLAQPCGRCSRPTGPPSSCPIRGGRGTDHGRPRRRSPRPEQAEDLHGELGLDNFGVADEQHASPAPSGARPQAGRLAGRPGPGPLPRRRITSNTPRVLNLVQQKSSPALQMLTWRRPGRPTRVCPGGGGDTPDFWQAPPPGRSQGMSLWPGLDPCATIS